MRIGRCSKFKVQKFNVTRKQGFTAETHRSLNRRRLAVVANHKSLKIGP